MIKHRIGNPLKLAIKIANEGEFINFTGIDVNVVIQHDTFRNVVENTIVVDGETIYSNSQTSTSNRSGAYKVLVSWIDATGEHLWNPETITFVNDSQLLTANDADSIDDSIVLNGAVYVNKNGASSYEIWSYYHPEWTGTEEEWNTAYNNVPLSIAAAEQAETNAKDSEVKAKISEDNAKLSEANSKASETASKTSETNSKTSETNAKTSETKALNSEQTSSDAAVVSVQAKVESVAAKEVSVTKAGEALISEAAAKISETNSKTSETNSKTSETNAANSEQSATSSEGVATQKALESLQSAEASFAAKELSEQAEQGSIEALNLAVTAKNNAKTSEDNAKVSETNSKTSETNSKASETAAKTSETNSKTSETNAAGSAEQSRLYSEELAPKVAAIYKDEFINVTPVVQYPLYFVATSGVQKTDNIDWKGCLLTGITSASEIYITGSVRPTITALAVYFNSVGGFISAQFVGTGVQVDYTKQLLTIPANCTSIGITSLNLTQLIVEVPEPKLNVYTKDETYSKDETEKAITVHDSTSIVGVEMAATAIEQGIIVTTGLLVSPTSGWITNSYDVQGLTNIYITSKSASTDRCSAAAFDVTGKLLLTYYVGTNVSYTKQLINLPNGAKTLKVSNGPAGILPKAYLQAFEKEYLKKLEADTQSIWINKTIWWCGTSIPCGVSGTLGVEAISGNYPTQVGTNLKATVVNKAVGGSMCRANVRTGNYVGANISNITSALTMTKVEIENFITNYATIKGVLTGTPPVSLSVDELARLRASSFEDRLLPYLNGTLPMPNLFVFDHGHNDYKYTLSSGLTDIGLEPTVANITSGELATDTYMTNNNNEKLISFMGTLDYIPSASKNDFIASLNRNCFVGAVNFLVTLILKFNPKARIVFISNYEYSNGMYPTYAPLITAQENIAKSWAFPLCKVYESLGFSNHFIPGSKSVAGTANDVQVFQIYCPDTVHPHTDTTGHANKVYAGILSEFIKNIR